MNCLVTGAAGFIGSHLVKRLSEHKHAVIATDLFSRLPTIDWMRKLKGVATGPLDVRKPPGLVAGAKADVIFHLAAVSRIGVSFNDIPHTYNTNVVGTANVVELAKQTGGLLVYAGSCTAVTAGCEPMTDSPYAHSKFVGEQIVTAAGGRVARLFNVYGPPCGSVEGDSVVDQFARKWANRMPLTVFGDGRQLRDYIHVSDVVEALISVALRGNSGETYAIGTRTSYSVLEVAGMFGGRVVHVADQQGNRRMSVMGLAGGGEEHLKAERNALVLGWRPAEVPLRTYIENFKRDHAAEA